MNILTPITRTAIPYLVGWLVSLFALSGADLTAQAQADIGAFLTFAIGTLYYVAVLWLEKRWPRVGVLLGIPKPPTYGPVVTTVEPYVSDISGGPAARPTMSDGTEQRRTN